MEKYESPLEKASQLKQQLEEEAKQKAEQEQQEKLDGLSGFLEEQQTVHSENIEEIMELKQDKHESTVKIEASKTERQSVQKEGKEAAAMIREVKEKLDYKNDPALQEIFAPVIQQLKQINEEVKAERLAKGEISKELKEKIEAESKRVRNVIKDFQNDHPELDAIYQKADLLEKHKKNAIEESVKLARMKEQYASYMDHKVTFNERANSIKDVTADDRMEELTKTMNQTAETAQKEVRKLEDEVSEKVRKGKGFFESEKSFTNKIAAMREHVEAVKKEQWAPHNNAADERGLLSKYVYDLDNNRHTIKSAFGNGAFGSEALEKFFTENPEATLGQLLEEAQKKNNEYIESLQLDEEEKLLQEISEALTRSENAARREQYA